MYLYILWSEKINKYYVGVSNNPEKRLEYHKIGKSGSKSAFTKRAKDWKIVFIKSFESKTEAIKAESWIKK